MPILVNLRHLEEDDLDLDGQIPAAVLDIEARDEIVQLSSPLEYEIHVQKIEDGLLVQGSLSLTLDCKCVRCLKPFKHEVRINPWTAHFALTGEDAVAVVNDCVDLTPQAREDILLEFPQHPLCERDCQGLRGASTGNSETTNLSGQSGVGSPAWNDLDKLKF